MFVKFLSFSVIFGVPPDITDLLIGFWSELLVIECGLIIMVM